MNTAIALSTFATLSAPVKNALLILSTMLDDKEISIEVYRRWVRFIIRYWVGTVPVRIIGRPLSLVRKTAWLSLSCASAILSLGTIKNCGLKAILSSIQAACGICELAMLPAEVLLGLVVIPLSYVSSTKAATLVHSLTSFNARMDYLDYHITLEDKWKLEDFRNYFASPFRALVRSSDRPTLSSFRTFMKDFLEVFFEAPKGNEEEPLLSALFTKYTVDTFKSTKVQK